MRILSQDGNIDVNYDLVALVSCYKCKDGNGWFEIDIYSGALSAKNVRMAKYSTEEKARKAMEMLHGAYCGVVYMKHADYEIEDIDLSQELEKKIREEMMKPHFLDVKINNPVIECKIFQFPADDEMEV